MVDLDRAFSALAHPVRRQVLSRLRSGEAPVMELAVAFKISGPALTKHLHILERAGLITRSRDAQRRPCRLSAAPFRELDVWMESYRQFWDESLDRLGEHLEVMKAKSGEKGKENGK